MQIKSLDVNGILVLAPQDHRLDAASAATFKDSIREACQDRQGLVVLDLSNVDFVDSSGLGALVASMKAVNQQGKLELAAPTEAVSRLLALTRMNSVFTVHETVQAATGDIRQAG